MTQDRPASSSRWAMFQYSCRTLLLMMVVISVFFAWYSDREKLTKKVQRLDDELTVLRAALGDSVLNYDIPYDPYVYGANSRYFPGSARTFGPAGYSGYVRAGNNVPPPPAMSSGAAVATPSIPDTTVRGVLYRLFNAQKAWLSQNLNDNRDWQEFLAAYTDPFPYNSLAPSYDYSPSPPKAESRAKAKKPPSGDTSPKVDGRNYPVAKLLPVVRAMLQDGDSEVRLVTMMHLRGLERRFTNFVPTLIRVLDDQNSEVRRCAVTALTQMGPSAKKARPRLEELMNSSEAMDAVTAAAALAKIDPSIDLVSRLTELLTSESEQVSSQAAFILLQLGPEKAAPAVPTLLSLLDHKQARMRVTAAHAFSTLAPRDEAIDTLTEYVKKEKDPTVKMTMARIVLRLKAGVHATQSQSGKPYRRTRQLIFTSDDFRSILDEWERIWGLDQPGHAKPIRTHGGII